MSRVFGLIIVIVIVEKQEECIELYHRAQHFYWKPVKNPFWRDTEILYFLSDGTYRYISFNEYSYRFLLFHIFNGFLHLGLTVKQIKSETIAKEIHNREVEINDDYNECMKKKYSNIFVKDVDEQKLSTKINKIIHMDYYCEIYTDIAIFIIDSEKMTI